MILIRGNDIVQTLVPFFMSKLSLIQFRADLQKVRNHFFFQVRALIECYLRYRLSFENCKFRNLRRDPNANQMNSLEYRISEVECF